jgi:hypothetical protein
MHVYWCEVASENPRKRRDVGEAKSSLVKRCDLWHEKNLLPLSVIQSTYLFFGPDNRIPYSTKSPSGGVSHPTMVPSNGNDILSCVCV